MVAAGDGAAQDAGVAAAGALASRAAARRFKRRAKCKQALTLALSRPALPAGGGAAGSGFLAECADTLAARARMKVAADRQAESERMVREAAEAAAAAKAAAAAAGPVAGDDDGAAAGGEAGEGGAGPKKRKPKSAGAPKSRSELPTSGYHGVVKKSPNCFQCKTLVNGKVLFIGSFNTAESAARAYDVCMRDLTQRSGDKREPSYNFVSDAVAEKAAELAEEAVQQEGGSKMCGQCGEQMAVRLKVCRKCRQGSGTRSLFKGVRAKSGTAAVPPLGGPVVAAAGGDPDGEAPAPAAPVAAAKYQAFVWHDRTNEYIGTYHTEEEAALAYDMRYREVFGDGADVSKLNWPTIAEGQAAVDAALRVRSRFRLRACLLVLRVGREPLY